MSKQSAPFLNGTAVIPMGGESILAWHEIALSFQKADGTPYGAVTGAASMTATGAGADLAEAGASSLDLTAQRRWAPFQSAVRQITVTVVGAPADALCVVSVSTSTGL